jgi:hypothetical protein
MALTESDRHGPGNGEPPAAEPPVRWMFQYPTLTQRDLLSGTNVAGVSLPPDQGLRLGIPLRMPSACYITGSWNTIDPFYVKERFLTFTHWVAVQVQSPLLLRAPDDAGVPHKDLTCPK